MLSVVAVGGEQHREPIGGLYEHGDTPGHVPQFANPDAGVRHVAERTNAAASRFRRRECASRC